MPSIEKNKIVKVFTGREVNVMTIKGELESYGIPSLIRNDFNSGMMAGFFGGVPTAIDLYVYARDLKRANPIIKELAHAMKI